MEQSTKDQLEKWVKGESVHNHEHDECCPDFSCCDPKLLAPQREREAFANAIEKHGVESEVVLHLLMGFLGRMTSGVGSVVHVAGNIPDNVH